MGSHSRSAYDRLVSKVKIVDDCWVWTGANSGIAGYGRIRYKGVLYSTHRLMYLIKAGSVKEGNLVMHSCNNPACINPEHLSEGTYSDNTQQMWDEGRARGGQLTAPLIVSRDKLGRISKNEDKL